MKTPYLDLHIKWLEDNYSQNINDTDYNDAKEGLAEFKAIKERLENGLTKEKKHGKMDDLEWKVERDKYT